MSEAIFENPVKHVETSMSDASSAADRAAQETIPLFGDATRAAADAFRAAGRKASAVMSDLSEGVPETRDQVARHIQARPLTTVLLATGIGLLAGLILARR